MKKITIIFSSIIGLILVGILAYAGYLAITTPKSNIKFDRSVVATPKNDDVASIAVRQALFGDLHLHTSYSMDANVFGTKLGPRDAYRFSKGESMEVGLTGIQHQIDSPLDFAAVTDHAEGLGMIAQCYMPESKTYWNFECIGTRYKILLVFPRLFKANIQVGDKHARYPAGACGEDGEVCKVSAKTVWRDTINAANEQYQPGRFTTLIGFEYSPTLFSGGMIHRNVIFRNDQVPDTVFGASDGFAEDLFRWLDSRCVGDCRALSIPHNSNFSWGLMFGDRNANATPVTRENLALRAKYERLVEIFQGKGSSECTAGLANNDEACNFENIFPICDEKSAVIDTKNGIHTPKCVTPNDMVRSVLRRGLTEEKKWGFNPYKLGIVAATDNHNGLMGDTSEKNYQGHAAPNDSTPELRLGLQQNIVSKTLGFSLSKVNPGGLTGVWAEQNTRESIWDALNRRESWGTSGTRLKVRFFGGFNLPKNLHQEANAIERAYQIGVPMGSDINVANAGESLSFMLWAQRDLKSAPLQKLQIVKGWMEGDETHEKVYDVVCSDQLIPDPQTHRCPSNEAKVMDDCSISQDRGAAELSTTWTDPDFKKEQSAFYYVRVLENPVCRYSKYDAIALKIEHPKDMPAIIQERAWSSPIWYNPIAN